MSEDMLQHYEEVLEGNMVWVELSAELKAALNDLLHHQLADVDQVAPLDQHGVTLWNLEIWHTKLSIIIYKLWLSLAKIS